MFCPKCGSPVDSNTYFCPHCGTSLRGAPQPASQAPASSESNTMAILGFAFAFIIPLLGFIFSIIGLNKAKELGGNGRGLAIGGIIVSILDVVISIIVVAFNFAMIFHFLY